MDVEILNDSSFCFEAFENEIASIISDCKYINLPFDFPNVCQEVNYLLTKSAEVFFLKKSDLNEKILRECLENTNILLDMTWEKLNTGSWKDVDKNWRYIYTLASLFKVLCFLLDKNVNKRDIIKACDYGLLMGAPLMKNILSKIASKLSSMLLQEQGRDSIILEPQNKKLKPLLKWPNIKFKIIEQKDLSYEEFIENYKKKLRPVILLNMINDWPALSSRCWNIDYLLDKICYRIVPIEIGYKYTDENWTQKLMIMQDFIKDYIWNKSEIPGYLAQHNLFDQIPELFEDIKIPSYIIKDGLNDVDISIWFGPEGTISPLHHDPKHNFLAQVIGEKYIRLYPKETTEYLYPRDDTWLSNTSQVDVEVPDLDAFPLFSKAQYEECILKPGQLLYIPPECWHYVRSLSISLSISFWW